MIRRMQNLNNWHVFYILVFITLTTSIGSVFLNPDLADRAWWSGFLQNFSTEMMGAIATFALFELVIEARKREEDKQESIYREQKTLIIQMRSKDHVTAINAVEQLKANGWLEDGSLKGLKLKDANLSGADLSRANLSGADLRGVNLSGADLSGANLFSARLRRVNLSGASLSKFWPSRGANLSGADLVMTNLSRVNLKGVNLEHANMWDVLCDETTTLPDDVMWTEDVDWSQYGAVVIGEKKEWEAYRKEHGLDKDEA